MFCDAFNRDFRTPEKEDKYSQTALSIGELLFTSPPMTPEGDAPTTTMQTTRVLVQTTRVFVMKTWEDNSICILVSGLHICIIFVVKCVNPEDGG